MFVLTSSEDFLESNHKIVIGNNSENIRKIESTIEKIGNFKIIAIQNVLIYELNRKLVNSILTITKSKNTIEIKNKHFDYVPDFANNYTKLKLQPRPVLENIICF